MTIIGNAEHTKIAEAVVQRIQDLNLTGMSLSRIALRVLDEDLTTCLPGPPGVMVIVAGAERVSHTEGSNKSKIIHYPIGVVIGAKCPPPIEALVEIDRNLQWRQDVRNGLWHKSAELVAAGAPVTVFDIEWEPGRIFIPASWKKLNMWVGAMAFRVSSKEAI